MKFILESLFCVALLFLFGLVILFLLVQLFVSPLVFGAPIPAPKPSLLNELSVVGEWELTWNGTLCRGYLDPGGKWRCWWCEKWWSGEWKLKGDAITVREWPSDTPDPKPLGFTWTTAVKAVAVKKNIEKMSSHDGSKTEWKRIKNPGF